MNNYNPMFGEVIESEVVTAFVDGMLQIVITAKLDKVQVKSFSAGACRIPGIVACSLDTFAPYSEDNTPFILAFNPKMNANRCQDVRIVARGYAVGFIQKLKPTAFQTSLF